MTTAKHQSQAQVARDAETERVAGKLIRHLHRWQRIMDRVYNLTQKRSLGRDNHKA